MYRALYRKWRPRTFDDVIGQQQVTETLKNQIAGGRSSHAYIFIGTRGTGKTTCAKILARALNCEHPENGSPCNRCKSCLGIESGGVMDVVEIDAASNNGVENVRALREEAVYTPASVKKRVYIIDEVHMLSTSAFNALLKILEEPPEHLVFILATTELHKVPPTILSRCQRYSFRRISPDEVAGRLSYVARQEGIDLEPEAADFLGRLADGSMRDGLSLLDQCSGGERVTVDSVLSSMGMAGNFRIAELMRHIAAGDGKRAIELFQSLWNDGKSPVSVLGELSGLLRDVMMTKVAPKGGKGLLSGGFDDKTLQEAGKALTESQAMSAIEYIQDAVGRMKDGRDPRITAELCILGLCRPELADTPEQLSLRISRLERAAAEGRLTAAVSTPEPREEEPLDKAEAEPYDAPPPPGDEDEPPFDMEPLPMTAPPAPAASVEERPPDIPEPALSSGPDGFEEGAELWQRIKGILKETMPAFHFAHLASASGELREDKLEIYVSNSFQQSKLENTEPHEMIAQAVEKAAGRAIPFTVQVGQSPSGENMLDRLAQFGNVEFKN